jgi:hypothetical protein
MTATERAAGRFLRAPDGHPTPAAPSGTDEQTPAPTPAPVVQATDDDYDKEYGDTNLEEDSSGDQSDDGEEGDDNEEDTSESEASESGAEGASTGEDAAKQMNSRIEELERQLAEERRQREEAKKPTDEKPESGPAEDKAPDPADYEFGEADSKFIADWSRWNTRQEHRQFQQEQSFRQELDAIEQGWKGAISKPEIAEKYPDFAEKVTQGAADQKWECSVPMALLIKNSDVGPDVAYELASNPTEAARLAKMDPQDLLLEFGRLEGRVSAKASAPAAPPAPKRTTDAPKPPSNRSRGSGGQFSTEQDALYSKMLSEFN